MVSNDNRTIYGCHLYTISAWMDQSCDSTVIKRLIGAAISMRYIRNVLVIVENTFHGPEKSK